jgi:hypothetical protein
MGTSFHYGRFFFLSVSKSVWGVFLNFPSERFFFLALIITVGICLWGGGIHIGRWAFVLRPSRRAVEKPCLRKILVGISLSSGILLGRFDLR